MKHTNLEKVLTAILKPIHKLGGFASALFFLVTATVIVVGVLEQLTSAR